jgi:hypothetical protein
MFTEYSQSTGDGRIQGATVTFAAGPNEKEERAGEDKEEGKGEEAEAEVTFVRSFLLSLYAAPLMLAAFPLVPPAVPVP